jgi:putative transposase
MMRVKKPIRLKEEERGFLRQIISKGIEKARKLTRCRILLLADEGKSDKEIMDALKTSRNTIREVRRRYVDEGLESAINERQRSGAPEKFSGRQKAKITAIACSDPPEGRSRWTLRLIADKVVELGIVDEISYKTVERILKKTSLSLT